MKFNSRLLDSLNCLNRHLHAVGYSDLPDPFLTTEQTDWLKGLMMMHCLGSDQGGGSSHALLLTDIALMGIAISQ